MGANQWLEMDSWPPASFGKQYHLIANAALSEQPPSEDSPAAHYRYDPFDPTPSLGGPLLNPSRAGQQDNLLLEARHDVLTYTTEALEEELDIAGSVQVNLYVASSLPCTDFFVRICDVDPDGLSMNVSDGLLRVKPGVGEERADGDLRIQIELLPIAYRFLKGHRLRLQVSSGAHPRWNRNPGTGEPFTGSTRMLAANQTIYHDTSRPSMLILPVINSTVRQNL